MDELIDNPILASVVVKRGEVPGYTEAFALFSADGKYRYWLSRRWGEGPTVAFIMLNPSTADENVLDPTLRRCEGFARREGAGRMVIANLFALRSTDPRALKKAEDPVGPVNDDFIAVAEKNAAKVILGWGNHGGYMGRGEGVMAGLESSGKAYHLGPLTGAGQPSHPLYLRKDIELVRVGHYSYTGPLPDEGDVVEFVDCPLNCEDKFFAPLVGHSFVVGFANDESVKIRDHKLGWFSAWIDRVRLVSKQVEV